jgi:hypothetical protein
MLMMMMILRNSYLLRKNNIVIFSNRPENMRTHTFSRPASNVNDDDIVEKIVEK